MPVKFTRLHIRDPILRGAVWELAVAPAGYYERNVHINMELLSSLKEFLSYTFPGCKGL